LPVKELLLAQNALKPYLNKALMFF